ncbi:hypothetical protein EU534_02350 [Candidatus Heimdallarchaeota archaeon]|nr:MAG: hypothetical protein EU534_02350 [Candidatus Heimdallarchaeota archaeon]
MDYKGPPKMTKQEIYDFITEMKIARICTKNKDGSIHSIPVWYLVDGENIIVFTPETSQKAKNIRRNRKLSILIDNQDLQSKGVIIYGESDEGVVATEEEALTLFRRYMDEDHAQKYMKGSQKLATWIKFTIKPYKFASFDYHKDEVYRKAMSGE